MILLIDSGSKEAVRSLTDDHLGELPDLTVGDIVPVSVAILNRIMSQWDSNLFSPIDVSAYTIRIALGGFQRPVSGSFPVSYSAETGADRVSFNPDDEELETVLNSISTVTALGGVDVAGENGFFIITWRLVGVRALIVADPADLVPVSLIEIKRAITGTISVREVQTLELRQDVGAIATLATNSASPSITVTLVTQGDATHNHKIRLTFPGNRWGGTWTFSAISVTSDSISHAPSAEQIQSAIEALSSIGLGNVAVSQETENDFLVIFKNGRGNQAISGIAADGTTLKVIGTKSGNLDLTVPAMSFLIPDDEESAVVSLEVESTPGSGSPEKVLQTDVILNRAVISS